MTHWWLGHTLNTFSRVYPGSSCSLLWPLVLRGEGEAGLESVTDCCEFGDWVAMVRGLLALMILRFSREGGLASCGVIEASGIASGR